MEILVSVQVSVTGLRSVGFIPDPVRFFGGVLGRFFKKFCEEWEKLFFHDLPMILVRVNMSENGTFENIILIYIYIFF